MEIRRILNKTESNDLIELLERSVRSQLTCDVSTYARGRKRTWLKMEPQLTSNAKEIINIKPVPEHHELESLIWDIFRSVNFEPSMALCINGDVGILPHRDGSYAAALAAGINLGAVDWVYGKGWGSEIERIYLPVGAVYIFDCKRVHGATPIDPNRWAVNGWSLAKNRTYSGLIEGKL